MRKRIRLTLRTSLDLGVEAERLVAQTLLDNFFQTDKCAAANKKDVSGIDREEFLVRMFAPALRRNICDGAFQNLQQRLLHALTRHVASNRRVLVLAANLVDLVDVD